MTNKWTYLTLAWVGGIAAAILLIVGITATSTDSQSQRPDFAGVPAQLLEDNGVYLTLPVQAKGLQSEDEVAARLDTEYPGSKVKEAVLAQHKPGAGSQYAGPVWAFSVDTAGETTLVTGGGSEPTTAAVAFRLVFFNARTGEYLYDVQLNTLP